MAVGPVDVYIIGFPGNKFTGRIAAIVELVEENGTIRVLDLLFVMKDADGVTSVRLRTSTRRARHSSRSTPRSRVRWGPRTPTRSTTTSRPTARPSWSHSKTSGPRSWPTPARPRTLS